MPMLKINNATSNIKIPEKGPAHFAIIALLVLIYQCLLLGSLRTTSVTTDEFGHLPLAYSFLQTGETGWLLMNPPSLRTLAALPLLFRNDVYMTGPAPSEIADFWYVGEFFMERNFKIYHSLYSRARMALALLACLTGLVIYGFARAIAGPKAGIIALALFAFSPDFLAHGGLVTCDLAAALAVLCVFASLYYYTRERTIPRLLLVGFCVSLLPLSKFTSLFFIFMVPFMLVLGPGKDRDGKGRLFVNPGPGRLAMEILTIAFISWFFLCAAYGFQGMFVPMKNIFLNSHLLSSIKTVTPWLPVPLPESLVTAIDLQLIDGTRPWQSYLFGKVAAHGSPWSYLACMLFKWPLAFLAMLIISFFIARKEAALWTFMPGALFVLFISTVPDKQYGSRFLLPALGFFIVFVAAAFTNIDSESRLKSLPQFKFKFKFKFDFKLVLGILFLWYAGGTLASYPHYIGYFNELAGGPRLPHHGHQYLGDSNLDWGQDWIRLAEWQQDKGIEELQLAYFGKVDPGIYGVKYSHAGCKPKPGYLAISANLVIGLDAFRNMGRCYKFLQEVEPVARVGSSIWIYKIP